MARKRAVAFGSRVWLTGLLSPYFLGNNSLRTVIFFPVRSYSDQSLSSRLSLLGLMVMLRACVTEVCEQAGAALRYILCVSRR